MTTECLVRVDTNEGSEQFTILLPYLKEKDPVLYALEKAYMLRIARIKRSALPAKPYLAP